MYSNTTDALTSPYEKTRPDEDTITKTRIQMLTGKVALKFQQIMKNDNLLTLDLVKTILKTDPKLTEFDKWESFIECEYKKICQQPVEDYSSSIDEVIVEYWSPGWNFVYFVWMFAFDQLDTAMKYYKNFRIRNFFDNNFCVMFEKSVQHRAYTCFPNDEQNTAFITSTFINLMKEVEIMRVKQVLKKQADVSRQMNMERFLHHEMSKKERFWKRHFQDRIGKMKVKK